MTENDRTRDRVVARCNWPVRVFRPDEQPSDDLSDITTAEQRLAMMWPLALVAWTLAGMSLSEGDCQHVDFLTSLTAAGARFLVVGAHAMAVYGVPRATGDLDIWVATDHENVEKIWRALASFGVPVDALGVSGQVLRTSRTVVQIGVPPRRIDLMTGLSGLDFEKAWPNRVMYRLGRDDVPFLGRDDFMANKRATGRLKDLADLEILEKG